MKKLILCLIAGFVFYAQLLAQTAQNQISGIRENADFSQIQSIYLHITKTPNNAGGYVVFIDAEGQLCSTQGPMTLSVRKKLVIARSDAMPKPIEIAKEEITYSQQVAFKPEDFKFQASPSGGMVYALPFSLPPDKVADGDTMILEWQDFVIEQKVIGF